MRSNPGGTARAEGVFPPVFPRCSPLEALIDQRHPTLALPWRTKSDETTDV
jgi:hypothetical protein